MRNRPLQVKLEKDELVIRIGLETLAFAAEHCPELYDDRERPYPPYIKVYNKTELVKDVISEINKEEEDGTTPLHILFDEAIIAAWENGSLAFDPDKI